MKKLYSRIILAFVMLVATFAISALVFAFAGPPPPPPIYTKLSTPTLSASSINLGTSVAVSGSLSVERRGTLGGHTIRLQVSIDGGSIFIVDGTTTTDGVGNYTISYTPSETGVYNFRTQLIPSLPGNSGYKADNSSMSEALTVTSDTTPPIVRGEISPAPNGAGWNNTDVTITWSATDPESGIASGPTPATEAVSSEGEGQVFSATATNGAGLVGTGSVILNIDKTPPMVNITGPSIVLQGTSANAIVTASDALSGLVIDPSGLLPLDTSTLGVHSKIVTVIDKADNYATATLTYTVWGVNGPFAPLVKNGQGTGQYKAGSTIPVKFQLTDGTNLITTATGAVTIGSVSASFRWDATAQQYIANVKTAKTAETNVPVVLSVVDIGITMLTMVDLK